MDNPISQSEMEQRFYALQEAYNAANGHVVEVRDAHYRVVANGHVATNYEVGVGNSFAWKILAVQLEGQLEDVWLLTWTDHVANDWGEWFDTDTEAFSRLACLTRAVYDDTLMEALRDFHIEYKRGYR